MFQYQPKQCDYKRLCMHFWVQTANLANVFLKSIIMLLTSEISVF